MTTNEFRLTGSDVFGRYCLIEMKRFVTPNEFYVHKCIKSYRSNCYRDVPLKFGEGEYVHAGRCVDVVSVITCGIDETEVFAVPLDSIKFIEPQERTCKIDGVTPFEFGEYNAVAGYVFSLSCDHNVMRPYKDEPPKYCDECGARVVSGDGK